MRFAVLTAFLPACGLPAASIAKIATCAASYDACFVAAGQVSGDNAAKMGAYKACRAQVDAQCLTEPAPVDSASSAVPSATASAPAPTAVPGASAAPSAAPCVPDAFRKDCRTP